MASPALYGSSSRGTVTLRAVMHVLTSLPVCHKKKHGTVLVQYSSSTVHISPFAGSRIVAPPNQRACIECCLNVKSSLHIYALKMYPALTAARGETNKHSPVVTNYYRYLQLEVPGTHKSKSRLKIHNSTSNLAFRDTSILLLRRPNAFDSYNTHLVGKLRQAIFNWFYFSSGTAPRHFLSRHMVNTVRCNEITDKAAQGTVQTVVRTDRRLRSHRQ